MGCSQGCNIDIHYVLDRPHLAEGARVMRLKPRYNADVNQWWMCDEGRYGYKFIDQGRIRKVLCRGMETSWDTALTQLASYLSRIRKEGRQQQVGVLPSARQTNEELFLVGKLFKESLGITQCDIQVPAKTGTSDNFLIKADKNPNTFGASLLGFPGAAAPLKFGNGASAVGHIVDKVLAGEIKALWVFGHDLVGLFGEEKVRQLVKNLELFVYFGTNENATCQHAQWVLPSAVFAEKDGTFVNCQGRVQRISKVFEPLKESRPDWQTLLDLFARLDLSLPYKSPEEIFTAIASSVPDFAGLTYETIGLQGAPVRSAEVAAR